MKLRRSAILVVLVVLVTFPTALTFNDGEMENGSLNLLASPSPGSPDLLTDDDAAYESYAPLTDYYYKTDTASPSQYHVIWVHPTDPSDGFLLVVYWDGAYSSLIAATCGPGFDWVIVRPASSQPLYPMIHTYSGAEAGGNAYIEWESSTTALSNGAPALGFLDESELIETYSLTISSAVAYTLNLAVPDSANFDFYVYHLDAGEGCDAGNGIYTLTYSIRDGWGEDEVITDWSPSISGDCVVVVINRGGAGAFTLTATWPSTSRDGNFPLYIAFGAIALLGVSIIFVKWGRGRGKMGSASTF